MKTGFDFLPSHKQRELIVLCELIVEAMKPEMIILFGSYRFEPIIKLQSRSIMMEKFNSSYHYV